VFIRIYLLKPMLFHRSTNPALMKYIAHESYLLEVHLNPMATMPQTYLFELK
jgi:hypothetical protein